MASMKREKLSIINDDDRISKLPNSLTHYILSFMNTKLAVQTGALSRRWRNLWTSLPYIDFNFNTFPYVVNPSHSESESYKQKRSSFANFITHFLLRRNESGVISFRFSDVDHNVLVEPVVLESILYYAIKHQAQELYVNAFCRKQLELPHIFLDCDSLKVLSLENFCGIFKLPNSLGFLSLTSLILAGFYRFNDNFFASCPNLERLKLVFKSLAKIEDFYINAPNLKILEISTFKNFRQWKFCGSTRLSIFTPNLEYFKFSGGGPFFSFRSELPGVNHVEIDADASFITITEENKMDFGLILIRMLDEFNKAKSITLSLKTAQSIVGHWRPSLLFSIANFYILENRSRLLTQKLMSMVPEYFNHRPSSFSELKHLKLMATEQKEVVKLPSCMLNHFLNSFTSMEICT